jgi:diacylglycerol O-acyltransferase / wax synthase
MSDRMNPLDTWFLHIEDEVDHMHIGSVGILEGPPPPIAEVREALEAKLDLVPRYRQRFRTVPFGVARPVWVDDPHFSIEYHVRQTALPRPGGPEQLRTLIGRVMGHQLDRRRPLWETWVIEGLEGDRWALLSKVHHCVVDGIAGTDVLALLLEGLEGFGPPPPPRIGTAAWQPAPEPSRVRLLFDAALDLATTPAEQYRVLRAATRRPRRAVSGVVAAARGGAELLGLLNPMPRSSLTGEIGPHRRWVTARGTLADAKAIRRSFGGTVNDVVLAAIAAGYRDLLAKRGELSDASEVRTMVPVSLRAEDERGELSNRVAALFVPLPVTVADPLDRYARVRQTMETMKSTGEGTATAALVALSGIAPHMVVGLALRTGTRLLNRHQRQVSTVTTNVPGPQVPLSLLGRRLVEVYPYVPIGEGVRTGIAIFSYDGQLTFGVTGDWATTPDLEVLADGIERGFAELRGLVPEREGG